MKIGMGLSALLLGTTLLAGAAFAQNNGNNSGPPPGWPCRRRAARRSWQWGRPSEFRRTAWRPKSSALEPCRDVPRSQRRAFQSAGSRHVGAMVSGRHTSHNGHNGWWWYTNGAWFFYDQPTYPYPDSVSDNYSFDDDYAGAPDQGPGSNGYVWYYCNNPAGYYPYINSCRGPWQPVTPTPPQGYGQGWQGGPDADQDQGDDRGPPPGQPRGQFDGPQGGPPPGYGDNNDDNDDDQGPPPPGYNGDQGPPQGYGPPPGSYPPPR